MKEFDLRESYLTSSGERDSKIIMFIILCILLSLLSVGSYSMFVKTVLDAEMSLFSDTGFAWQLSLLVLCIFYVLQIVRMAYYYAKGYTWNIFNSETYGRPMLSFNLDLETIGMLSFFYFFAALLAPLIGMVVTKFVLVSVIKMSLWMISVLMVFLVATVAFTISHFARKRALERIEVVSKLRGS